MHNRAQYQNHSVLAIVPLQMFNSDYIDSVDNFSTMTSYFFFTQTLFYQWDLQKWGCHIHAVPTASNKEQFKTNIVNITEQKYLVSPYQINKPVNLNTIILYQF